MEEARHRHHRKEIGVNPMVCDLPALTLLCAAMTEGTTGFGALQWTDTYRYRMLNGCGNNDRPSSVPDLEELTVRSCP